MSEQKWHQRYAEGIVIGVLTACILTLIGYLNHISSTWFWPFFYGLIASSLFLIVCFVFLLLKRVPRRQVIPSSKNIESCVRTWLDNHKVAVKNDPYPEGYFRFRVTLDGGVILTILRSRSDYPEYVQISCDLGIRGENIKLLEQFTEDEKTEILFDIKRELARARVGYSGLVNPPENFMIVRRVPIYPTLSEFAFMSMIYDVEAAVNLVANVFLRMRWEKERHTSLAMPQTTSNIPIPVLPVDK